MGTAATAGLVALIFQGGAITVMAALEEMVAWAVPVGLGQMAAHSSRMAAMEAMEVMEDAQVSEELRELEGLAVPPGMTALTDPVVLAGSGP